MTQNTDDIEISATAGVDYTWRRHFLLMGG
jgi:hypothetical protein